MAKYPKFFIAVNPMADPEGIYIFHSRKPRLLAKVRKSEFEIMDDIDNASEFYRGDPAKLNSLIGRMADW
ncbi:MAG: hypothetical protein LBH61_04255, partial [Dysgonamonadaceae bacterium]|nr:hypothetical protein [Dysgonamonadaceae bacterium]